MGEYPCIPPRRTSGGQAWERGGASLGIMTDLVNTHGAHSLIGRMGATIFGSTETTFYVIAVYFGSVGVRKARHAVIAGLASDLTAPMVSVMACNFLLA
jgi:spore maturation protein B